MSGLPIDIPQDRVREFCAKWRIVEFSFFGSVLRDDFRPDSDLDVLVTFADDARHTLFDLVRMKEELSGIMGRNVDLVSRRGIESSRNPIRKQAILSSARVIHAASICGEGAAESAFR